MTYGKTSGTYETTLCILVFEKLLDLKHPFPKRSQKRSIALGKLSRR